MTNKRIRIQETMEIPVKGVRFYRLQRFIRRLLRHRFFVTLVIWEEFPSGRIHLQSIGHSEVTVPPELLQHLESYD